MSDGRKEGGGGKGKGREGDGRKVTEEERGEMTKTEGHRLIYRGRSRCSAYRPSESGAETRQRLGQL